MADAGHRWNERESWQAIAGAAGSAEWEALAAGRPPRGVDEPPEVSRRGLLKLAGASIALAGAAGCAPREGRKILPYADDPPDLTPGVAERYATSMVLDGYATGLVVASVAGRPIKIEGNPDHPASLGATGVFEQASILGLYDPYRARAPRMGAGAASFRAFVDRFVRAREDRGAGLRFLIDPTTSPLVRALVGRVRARHPAARFTFWSPVQTDHAGEGARAAFGRAILPQYDLSRADVVLAIDADFCAGMPFCLRHARAFADRRRPGGGAEMSRLYVVETMVSPTGTLADHRLRARPSEIAHVTAEIAAEITHGLGLRPPGLSDADHAAIGRLYAPESAARAAFVRAVARDLARRGQRAVVIVGERQPALVHALGHVINAAIGSLSTWAIDPLLIDAGPATQGFTDLTGDLGRGAVDTLVMLETNPVYAAPADAGFGEILGRVRTRVTAGLYDDETARLSDWFIPVRHYLETWGDAQAYDGTVSFVQPLIRPLFGGPAITEVLAVFAGETAPHAEAMLRAAHRERHGEEGFPAFFQAAIQRGFLPGSAAPRVTADLAPAGLAADLGRLAGAAPGGIEVAFHASPQVHDGRFADNPWLLELPRPVTKLTWDNAAMMSAGTAARLGIATGDVVTLALGGRRIRIPALVVRGHADDAVSVDLGLGREGAEEVARGVGVSAYRIRTSDAPWFRGGLTVEKTGATARLALSQTERSQHGRPIAETRDHDHAHGGGPLADARGGGPLASLARALPGAGPLASLARALSGAGGDEQWAMSIDLSICTGCSACVVACQAENNVLVVGKEEVARGRVMHWIRIDQYDEGEGDDVRVVSQPMLCQHCEKAPCEYVCPVNATVHSPDGLNEMIYNRCIGTRFCSNNCPYKVRRFNWFDWHGHVPYNGDLRKLQKNPDVTVRARGVMEKCTYCVQRIRRADIQASIERRPIRPGEVETACQQACPTGAIQFGSLRHPDSKVVRWREDPRAYALLEELGTEPRTRYLARVLHPNREMG